VILHPAIIALLSSSVLICLLVLLSAWHGLLILRRWDLTSGSSVQLGFERRTYLISTVLGYVFGFQLFSLFLFIYTADSLSPLFVGAMCAAGTLNVNSYGYPALVLKVMNFLVAGLWLIVNHADNRASDYPLIRKKYAFLLVIAPPVVAEAVLQALYFLDLSPDVITSCCGSLFGAGGRSVASEVAAFPAAPMMVVFFAVMALAVAAGIVVAATGRGGYVLAFLSGAAFLIAIASILSFISLYVYELPSHHCPFCILQKEYGCVGYPLYATLLTGSVCGMGVGALMPFREIPSLAGVIPPFQRRLAAGAFVLFAIFTVMALVLVLRSELVL
jgi:hypothetical protein